MHPRVEATGSARQKALVGTESLADIDDDAGDGVLVHWREAVELGVVARHSVLRAVAGGFGIDRCRLAPCLFSGKLRKAPWVVEGRKGAEDRFVLFAVEREDALGDVEARAVHLDGRFQRTKGLVVKGVVPAIPHEQLGLT